MWASALTGAYSCSGAAAVYCGRGTFRRHLSCRLRRFYCLLLAGCAAAGFISWASLYRYAAVNAGGLAAWNGRLATTGHLTAATP